MQGNAVFITVTLTLYAYICTSDTIENAQMKRYDAVYVRFKFGAAFRTIVSAYCTEYSTLI